MTKHLFWSLITILIFLTGAFLRLYQVSERFVFDIDVQYQTLLAWEQVKNFHVIWIGVSASNLGYYLGPGLVYLTALLLKISNGDPLILGYFASLIGVLTMGSLFYILNNLYKFKTALIGLCFYSFSQFTLFYDRHYWPFAIPLISLWIFYSLVKSWSNIKWMYLAIFLIATSYHIHLSLLLFWPFILLTIFLQRKKIKTYSYFLYIVIFIAITSPLLVFDFLHNFDNLLFPLRYFLNYESGNISMAKSISLNYLLSILGSFFAFRSNNLLLGTTILILIVALIAITLRDKITASISTKYSVLCLGLILLAVVMYPGPLQEYYGVILFPFVILILSIYLSKFKSLITVLIILVFAFFNIFSFLESNLAGLSKKKEFILKIKDEIGTTSFYLDFENDRDFEGWRYLFQAYGLKPTASKSDEMFGWIYKDSNPDYNLKIYITNREDEKVKNTTKKISYESYTAYLIQK